MKGSLLAMTLFFGLVTTAYFNKHTEPLSYPELGITCIEVRSIFGNIVPAGCYTGDIMKNSQFNASATMKYQPNFK